MNAFGEAMGDLRNAFSIVAEAVTRQTDTTLLIDQTAAESARIAEAVKSSASDVDHLSRDAGARPSRRKWRHAALRRRS